mgnify:CR=1 FL=1
MVTEKGLENRTNVYKAEEVNRIEMKEAKEAKMLAEKASSWVTNRREPTRGVGSAQ